MSNVTSTTFGYVIAFLLPGMVGLVAASYWFPRLRAVLQELMTCDVSFGFFFGVILLALVAGLQVCAARWAVYEMLIRKIRGKDRVLPEEFARLTNEGVLKAFRASVDEIYRYHQFWGAMSLLIPVVFFGWGLAYERTHALCIGWVITIFAITEVLTCWCAYDTYFKSLGRSKKVLSEDDNG